MLTKSKNMNLRDPLKMFAGFFNPVKKKSKYIHTVNRKMDETMKKAKELHLSKGDEKAEE